MLNPVDYKYLRHGAHSVDQVSQEKDQKIIETSENDKINDQNNPQV